MSGDRRTSDSAASPEAPLAGVRVIELAGIGPMPLAGMLLGDLGADVVLIRRGTPGEFDVLDVEKDPVLRNRRVLHADLGDAGDLDRVLRLIDRADVLMEGFRPGATERLGIGPDVACGRNPRLIYGRMTGWGQSGPTGLEAGHDINYLAVTGALHALGASDRPPPVPLNLVADCGGGALFLVLGVLSALIERERSGLGQVIDAAMIDGVSALLQPILSWRAAGIWSDDREHNLLDGAAPFYTTYTCADGRFIAVGALEKRFYAQLLAGLELQSDDLPDRDQRLHWPALRAVFARRFAERTRDQWAQAFAGTDACVTPVLTFGEAPRHPQLAHRGSQRVGDGGTEALPAPRFSRSMTPSGRPARRVGPDEVLSSWPLRALP